MRLGFIGTGAMSGAIARGLRDSGSTANLWFYDVNTEAAQGLAAELGGQAADLVEDLVSQSEIVILGVKPHIQRLVLQQIAPALTSSKAPALVSIAAGRSLTDIFQDLTEFGVADMPPLIRVMPNVNAQIGMSMSALTACPNVPAELKKQTLEIFSAVGQCIELAETQFGVFSALASASPAWFFQIIESFARAGVKHGLTKAQSLQIVAQSMLGSAQMTGLSLEKGILPGALIDQVCSPGGTTIAGLLAAQAAGLDTALVDAVDATVRRDQELGG